MEPLPTKFDHLKSIISTPDGIEWQSTRTKPCAFDEVQPKVSPKHHKTDPKTTGEKSRKRTLDHSNAIESVSETPIRGGLFSSAQETLNSRFASSTCSGERYARQFRPSTRREMRC